MSLSTTEHDVALLTAGVSRFLDGQIVVVGVPIEIEESRVDDGLVELKVVDEPVLLVFPPRVSSAHEPVYGWEAHEVRRVVVASG